MRCDKIRIHAEIPVEIENGINHYAGLGEKWFLTYKPLNISMHDLGTDDFRVAKEKSYLYIKKIFEEQQEAVTHAMQMLSTSLGEKDDFSWY